MFEWLKRKRGGRSVPFPASWRAILQKHFKLFQHLPPADQLELEQHIQVFLAKNIEGCDGLVITDEIRVTIAAQACLLLLHRSTKCYPGLRSIVIYPSTYTAKTTRPSGHGVVTESHDSRLGESWQHGAVVLAWDSVLTGAWNIADGHNVVLHEFAHQLDQEDGRADGAPTMDSGFWSKRHARYAAWARILGAEFESLREQASKGTRSVMDTYGATDPAEFFAVATECFFEKPRQMLKKHPDLYEELRKFYQQDPSTWTTHAPDRE